MIFDETTRKLSPEAPGAVIARKADHSTHGTPCVYLAAEGSVDDWEEIPAPIEEVNNNEEYAE